MEIDRLIGKTGDSLCVILPPDYAKHFKLEHKTPIKMKVDTGKYGEFISIWRADQKKVENDKDGEIQR